MNLIIIRFFKSYTMKKLLLLLLFIPLISFGQAKYIVSAKEGLNVREQPSLESKKIATLVYGQKVIIESKTGKKLTINDVDYGYLGRFNIEGEWVEITSETEVKGLLIFKCQLNTQYNENP
tara:strand:- start:680 stop:1042 length:363 start_codon:yes stop_codon:yes gene_type:complete